MQKHDLLVALTNYNVVGRVSWFFILVLGVVDLTWMVLFKYSLVV